jgi:hypothetical protein
MKESVLVTIWTNIKDVVSRTSAGSVLWYMLWLGLVALAIDYAYMIYFYMRMVKFDGYWKQELR